MDVLVLTTAPEDVQRSRVLGRGTMTSAEFETILAKQTPDAEKRARADFVVETLSLDVARAQVEGIVATLEDRLLNA